MSLTPVYLLVMAISDHKITLKEATEILTEAVKGKAKEEASLAVLLEWLETESKPPRLYSVR